MMKIVIIDDELSAREILASLLERYHAEHEVVGIYESLPDSIAGIKETNPDLVFLDIEMPEYAGYEIVNFFDEINFEIVFTTAYSQYALKAFEVAAIDYLLKPIEIDRLADSISRVEKLVRTDQDNLKLNELATLLKKPEHKISYIDKGYRAYVSISEIVALEAQRAYTKVHTKEGDSILISKNIRQFENELKDHSHFFRTHRSWIVNLNELEKLSKTKLEVHLTNNTIAKLSKQYIKQLDQLISNP
ncbi:MAG: response regulator transcription factor [Flavobacteriales bacterium]|nr:response regulator transcription factor [Flavobacteriales bacterium]